MVGQVKRTKEDNCERLVKLETRYRVRVDIENGIFLVLPAVFLGHSANLTLNHNTMPWLSSAPRLTLFHVIDNFEVLEKIILYLQFLLLDRFPIEQAWLYAGIIWSPHKWKLTGLDPASLTLYNCFPLVRQTRKAKTIKVDKTERENEPIICIKREINEQWINICSETKTNQANKQKTKKPTNWLTIN